MIEKLKSLINKNKKPEHKLSDIQHIKAKENPLELRDKISIICIDDQGFPYEEIITGYGFKITVAKDIENIRSLSDYSIVICDIGGVGKKFKSKLEGGQIIKEIKKIYPEKILIAFTGMKFDIEFSDIFKICDYKATKDIDSDQWVNILDQSIAELTDPVKHWKRVRKYLYEKDIETSTVAKLEASYIESILTKSGASFDKNEDFLTLPQDVRGVLQGISASTIYGLLTSQG